LETALSSGQQFQISSGQPHGILFTFGSNHPGSREQIDETTHYPGWFHNASLSMQKQEWNTFWKEK
jgi:hypothetical protein